MLVLGIETTCDETAAAVIERQPDGSGRILSNVVHSQIKDHAPFGGVVPEIAARAHVDLLDGIVDAAMKEAGVGYAQLGGVAAAAGPGLIGGVIVGLTTAKAIALVHGTPLLAINHLEAHALTPRLVAPLDFPYCLFLASGGHTQIVAVLGVGNYVRIGTTVDDAIGEAFDKVAKLLGLPYPGRTAGGTRRGKRRRDALRVSAADARTRRRKLFAVGTEDRRAAGGGPQPALERAGRERSLRRLPGRRAELDRRPAARRPCLVPPAIRRADGAGRSRRRRRQSRDPGRPRAGRGASRTQA